ncbi:MAG: acyl-CoA thioesterase [Oscillospiraceae bacterium]|nr:acyl-CoA thioesterase [Oscillospiraceae bacterium]
MKRYTHKVNYYETDRMGITHHSNYIRWMEEARIDFLEQLGWGYDKIEAMGIISPVTAVDCRYKNTTTFADVVDIEVWVAEFRGVKLKIGYLMTKSDGTPVCEAVSEHCFLNSEGKIISLKRTYPRIYESLCQYLREE